MWLSIGTEIGDLWPWTA